LKVRTGSSGRSVGFSLFLMEISMKRLLVLMMILLGAGAARLPGGLGVDVRYDGYYSDNIFFNASAVEDYVSNFGLSLDYTARNFTLFADVSASLFRDNGDFNSIKVEPGIEYLKYLKGRNYLYVTGGYSILGYRELFTDFNYHGPFAEIGLKYYIDQSFLLKAGYSFQKRIYQNFSSFDFDNHTLFLEANRFLNSNTTLRLRTGLNYRYYPHITIEEEVTTDGAILMQGPGGKGPGKQPDPATPAIEANSISVPNVFAAFRVAQGFGPNLGLVGEVEWRKNFQGLQDAGQLIENSYVIYPYNDDYLWDGQRYSIYFNAIPAGEVVLNTSLSFTNKNYQGIYIMDEEGQVIEPYQQRQDHMVQVELKLSRQFKKFNLFISGLMRDNQSNDDYFTYKLWSVSTGVDILL